MLEKKKKKTIPRNKMSIIEEVIENSRKSKFRTYKRNKKFFLFFLQVKQKEIPAWRRGIFNIIFVTKI